MSVRLCDVLRFIQSTQSVSDLETIRDEVGFFLTLAERDWPSHMRGQDAHCGTLSDKSCIGGARRMGLPTMAEAALDPLGAECDDAAVTQWWPGCATSGGVR